MHKNVMWSKSILEIVLVFSLLTPMGGGSGQFEWERGFNQTGGISDSDQTGNLRILASEISISGTIAAGAAHTCALTRAGGMKCWGANFGGQLGDNSTTTRLTPVDVLGLPSGIRAIAGGRAHTCILTSEGGVKCWGYNQQGELGDGTTTDRLGPVDVIGLENGVSAISAGNDHTCAVTNTGGVKCWGYNDYGQLGDGTIENRLTPVSVVGLSNDVIAVAAGDGHTCALTGSGGVKCWGDDEHGQLGNGNNFGSLTPIDVVGLSSGVIAIATGWYHTCAVTSVGGVKCWGYNGYGNLGDGTTTNRMTPVDVVGLASGVSVIKAGLVATCALTSVGGVKCWGYDGSELSGDETIINSLIPMDVVGLASGVRAITGGYIHACVLMDSGVVKCWGSNEYGQIGDPTVSPYYAEPTDVINLTGTIKSVNADYLHTCVLTDAGGVKCWGYNWYGQLGDGTTENRRAPVDVVGLVSGVTAIAVGGLHTCGLTSVGGVMCWGYNYDGQLGDGTTTDHLTPLGVLGISSEITAITARHSHNCALNNVGGVKCWGDNYRGQLGDGTTKDRLVPVDVVGLTSGVKEISTGGAHTCALTDAGGVKCWGDNYWGKLGDGTTTDRLVPVDVVGLTSGVKEISTGGAHTCALTDAGGMKCWGYNGYGNLGDGTTVNRLVPVDVVGLDSEVSAITAAVEHTCALTIDGIVKCWGYNDFGQLGDGTTSNRLTPVDVVGLENGASVITAGHDHTCAVTSMGGVKCWGSNMEGQIGNGKPYYSLTPVVVIGVEGVIFGDWNQYLPVIIR